MHYQSKTKLYFVWLGMRARCTNPKHISYKIYGARGITVCKEWQKFVPFLQWALNNGYKQGLTIERLNNNKGYCPENCTWATRKEQIQNSSQIKLVTAFGETKSLIDWAGDERCQVKYTTLSYRLNHGWSAKEALSTATSKRK